MTWIGIRIDLFFTVREAETPVEIAQPPDAYNFSYLTAADVDDLIRLEPGADRERLNTWFREGKLCYGVRDNSRLVAKMWCDLDEFNYQPNYRKLVADEVYLYAAFADPKYRGRGLAPQMRAAVYASLREMGYRKFYSYTDFSNTAARRFKAKLGAQEEALRIHLELFKKWSTTLTLRRYS
jgi:RimJ/RimL family protein N-acetyltransferase